jgi:hypothetical protein
MLAMKLDRRPTLRRAQTPPEDVGSGALSSADTCPAAPCPDGPEELAVTGG